jgi:CRISPR/Cas system-associated exonuclease Cas4 (RecB family)
MALSLAPPPEGIYESVEDALEALNTFAAAEGYAIVKRRSILSKRGVIRRVDLKCDKGGEVKPYVSTVPEERQRISSSRLTNCPFSMSLYLEKDDQGKTQWRTQLRDGSHNHTATKAVAHPIHRQLSSSRRKEIENQCDAGIAPQQTHVSLL